MASYPPRFGPVYWDVIHLTAKRLDFFCSVESIATKSQFSKEITALHRFMHDLPLHLPCPSCGQHFTEFMAEDPLPPTDKYEERSFFQWSVRAHNHTNRLIHKREITYEEAEALFKERWYGDAGKLQRAEKNRLEDHRTIKALQRQMGQQYVLKIWIAVLGALLAVVIAFALYLAYKH
jgi:hypothetical protein